MTTLPSTTIAQARERLAQELGLAPDDLEYVGPQEGLGYTLVLFNVNRPGPGNHTTRSVRVDAR